MAPNGVPYPLRFDVDYPTHGLNRLTTFFRLIWVIPILTVYGLLLYGTVSGGWVFFPVLLTLLFRSKYPRWWFDWNVALLRFAMRVGVYASLMRDEYPSTDEEQAVHLEVDYPDAGRDLNRWLPLVKWFLAIPHYAVLLFLSLAALAVDVIAWFAILFTGRYPRPLFDFVVGVTRWSLRVIAYAGLLVTDRYPPFSLQP